MKRFVFRKGGTSTETKPKKRPPDSRDLDVSKVKSGKPKRVLKKFKEKRLYECIIEYREGAAANQYQRIGIKADGGLIEAVKEAERYVTLIGKALSVDLYEIRSEKLCRLVALYAVDSFKDWESTVARTNKDHIKEVVARIANIKREKPKKIGKVTSVQTR